MDILRIDPADVGILVIDVQPFFIKYAFEGKDQQKESLLVRIEHLLKLADWMDLPTVATFEKPTSFNGEFPERLEKVGKLFGLLPKDGITFRWSFITGIVNG